AAMSVPPPGPKPTVMRIGRVGQSCAGAGAPASATTSTTASAGIPMPAKYPRRAMASSYFRVIGPLRLLVLDRIAQRADPFDLDLACIAVPHQHRRLARKANAGRCSGNDEIARIEGDALRDVDDGFGDREHHVGSVVRLHDLTVKPTLDLQAFAQFGQRIG